MSAVPNARKNAGSSIIRKLIKGRGRVKRGGKPETDSSSPTQPVLSAVIRAECHTIPELKYMVNPNISIFQKPNLIAKDAIWVSIVVTSGAGDVKRLDQNEKVNSAIDALLRRIRNELYFGVSTGNDSKTKASRITGRRSKTNGKE